LNPKTIIAIAARTYLAKKEPAVIYDGRLFFGTRAIFCGRYTTQRLLNLDDEKRRETPLKR
jgi:hypothetical protein